MPPNQISIKLSSTFIDEVRREADVLHRSVGAQVEYWAKLGRAIENTPGFSLERVRETMEGRLRIEAIPDGAEAAVLRELSAGFDKPDATTRAYFSALGERPGAVGGDGKGGVVRRQPPRNSGRSE